MMNAARKHSSMHAEQRRTGDFVPDPHYTSDLRRGRFSETPDKARAGGQAGGEFPPDGCADSEDNSWNSGLNWESDAESVSVNECTLLSH